MKTIILGALLIVVFLTACGQKGNLYLPDPTPAQSTVTPAKP